MKVLLVHPTIGLNRIGQPIGLSYIASFLEKYGHEVKIIDSLVKNLEIKDINKEMKKFNADVIGVTSMTPSIFNALSIIKNAKEINPNCLSVLGGPHPTAMDIETLKENPFVDVIIRGEGEITFKELLETKKKDEFSNIRGITYRDNNKIVKNENRPFIENIDELPFPAYHLLEMDEYKIYDNFLFKGIFGDKYQNYCSISASRGCPHGCIFCECNKILGRKIRNRNPEKIVEEIKILADKYKVKMIGFIDDTFTIDKKQVISICNLIKKEKIDLSIECSTRVDSFDKEIADNIKKTGFKMVFFGFESANQTSLDFLKKGFKIEDIKTAVRKAKQADLIIEGNFMIGIPGETRKMINNSISYARKLGIDQASFPILVPFPGTELYSIAERNNLLLTKDWSKYHFNNSVMKIDGFSPNELIRLKNKAYLSFYSNPTFIYKFLRRNLRKT